MRFHQYVKPHHHLTIWIMAVFQVVLALGVYANATLLYAQEYTREQSQEGPSEETQEFFGGKVKKTTGSLPAACQQFQNQNSSSPSASPESPNQTPPTTKAAPITPQASESYQSSSPYSSAEPSDYQSFSSTSPRTSSSTMTEDEYNRLSDDEKRRYREKYTNQSSPSPLDSLAYPTSTRPSYDTSSGPPGGFTISADCQKAMITQIRSEMSEFRDKMRNGGFTAKLDNILAVIDKLENGVDSQKSGLSLLQAQGMDTSAIQALFGPIREDTQTLKEFFAEMLAAMDAFFAIDDPEEAFTYMRTQFPQSKPASMGKIADRLVGNIKDLVNKLKALSEQLDTTTGGSDAN